MKSLYFLTLTFLALPTLAHEGHGLYGSHWHATDVLGFVGAAAAVAVAIWLSKK
jgi:hypothetical protein